MRFLKIIIVITFLFVSNLLSKEIYVNGAIGIDSVSNDGSTPALSVKSIKKAISLAVSGDEIIVEGLNGDSKIIYKESNIIDKESIRITGANNPVIDGSEFNSNNNAAFIVNFESFSIKGITLRNFAEGNLEFLKLKGGAGIASNFKLKDLRVINCVFERCNFGIVAFENQSIRIFGNKFSEIVKSGSNLLDGGIALLVWSNGSFIQDNNIGSESGNEFNSFEGYGILIGSDKQLVLGDYTKIENNKFNESKRGTGLGLFFIEGIFTVKNNIFDKNYIGIELKGESVDVSVESNIFKGSISESEIISDEKYPGDMLYSIWKSLGNKFEISTFSKSKDEISTEIILDGGKRHIRNKIEAAEKDGKNKGFLLK
jgi:nitrous oxidase accessory protein NosD